MKTAATAALRVQIAFVLISEILADVPVWEQNCIQIPDTVANRFRAPMGIDQLYGPNFEWGKWWSDPSRFSNNQPVLKTILPVKIYGVKIKNPVYDRWMMGWLRIKIGPPEGSGNNKYFTRQFLLHGEDVNGKALGQFVECPNCNPPSTPISKFQILPCIAVPNKEPLPPTYIIHTILNNPALKNKADKNDYIPNENIPAVGSRGQEWNFYWRYSEFYCNALTKFRFRFIYFLGDNTKAGSDYDPGNDLKYGFTSPFQWIETKNLLGSDAIPEDDSGKACTSPDSLLLTPTSSLPRWIGKVSDATSYKPNSRCGGFEKWYTFEGRCSASDVGPGSQDNAMQCEPKKQTSQSVKEMIKELGYRPYDDYVKKRTEHLTRGCKARDPCPVKLTTATYTVLPAVPTSTTPGPVKKLFPRYYEDPNFHGRLLHGFFMIIMTMFVTPVNAFIARYYKETFMQNHINFCPFWFFVHHLSILFVGLLLFGSLCVTVAYHPALSHVTRLNHRDHAFYGGLIVFLYVCLALFGGFRMPFQLPCLICMCIHWLFATVFYIGSLVLIVQSAFAMEHSHKKAILVCGIVSGVSEIVFHVIMSILLVRSDKAAEFSSRRMYVPVPVPLRDPRDNSTDLPGTNIRVLMLILQVLSCLIITIVTLYFQNIDHNYVYVPSSVLNQF